MTGRPVAGRLGPAGRRGATAFLAAALAGCGAPPLVEPPGYSGPLPSGEAQLLLKDLAGAEFEDTEGVLGGGRWTVHSFLVAPNPVSRRGTGPVVVLEQGETHRYIPVETDGDAADLHRRVHGTSPPGLAGELSEAYQAAWRPRRP